jgi:sugar lactone lactonase YvrE
MLRHILAAALLIVVFASPSRAAPGDVAAEFASPTDYPAGLTTDGTHLYVLDWRAARIHQIRIADHAPVRTFDAPTLRPHGLTWHADRLWISDDHSGWIFALNPETGVVENRFEAPGEMPTGLAAAGDALYLLEARSDQIYEVLPEDGTILQIFDAPTKRCTCLAFDGRYLWAVDRIADEFYRIHPETGLVVGILAAPGPHAAGLDFHDGQALSADFQTRKIYTLDVDVAPHFTLREPREARVELLWSLYNYGPGDVTDLTVHLGLPPLLPNQVLQSEIHFATPPAAIVTDRWNQRSAVFNVPTIAAGTRHEITYHVDARLSAIRYLIDPARCGTLADIPADIRDAYTADGARYRIDTPFIQKTVREIVGDEQNPYWIARKIFSHIIATLEYQMVGGWDVPEVVLQRGTGSCSEYTFCLIALCRAAGVPARYQGSLVVRGDDASIDEAHHRWAQVYLPNYGWVPVDANAGDKRLPADRCRGFGELANRFLITTQGGGASEHLAWGYNYHATYQTTGRAKIEHENYALFEPIKPAGTGSDTPAGDPNQCQSR